MRRVATLTILALLAAAPAMAQTDSDAIGNILAQPPGRAVVPDEPDTASQPVTAPEPQPVLPAAPQPYTPPRPQLTEPVHIEETGKTPDGPPTPRDLAYDSRIRSSFASAQSFQGPLDGAWTLSAGGQDLYTLKLVDRGRGEVEGAWLDLRRKGTLGSSGFIDTVERTEGDVVLRFSAAGPVSITLEPAAAGWRGELAEGGRTAPATLRRAPTP